MKLPMMTRSDAPPARHAPILVGLSLLGGGLALKHWKPLALSLPDRPESLKRDRGGKRKARQARDGMARLLPANLNESLGQSLMLLGGGLLALRLLDEVVEDQERLF